MNAQPAAVRARSAKYNARAKRLGLVQTSVWIPADKSTQLLLTCAHWRADFFEALLKAGSEDALRLVAGKSSAVPGPMPSFEDFTEGVPALQEGGTNHKHAVILYNQTLDALRALANARATAQAAEVIGDVDDRARVEAVMWSARLYAYTLQRDLLVEQTRTMP